jgi:glycosyltransferase involved in cell wall biosynthesis
MSVVANPFENLEFCKNRRVTSNEVLVSIIIPVKDGMPYFSQVIDMLRKQETDFGYEIIVIDSGSKDGSLDIIPRDDGRFRLIQISSAEYGHGKTRNLGVAESRGEFCAFLTHDAVPANPHWLKELVRPLFDDERVVGVFGRHIAHQGASAFTSWDLDQHFRWLQQRPVVWISDARAYVRSTDLQQFFHFYSDNSSCLRKSVWKTLPYPDVSFAEDQLWAKKVVEQGYRKAFAWNSVVRHSHEYKFWQRLSRSYDEAKALREHFGYVLCGTTDKLVLSILYSCRNDVRMALSTGWLRKRPLEVLKRLMDNVARFCGYYIAAANFSLVRRHERRFSRDKELFERR